MKYWCFFADSERKFKSFCLFFFFLLSIFKVKNEDGNNLRWVKACCKELNDQRNNNKIVKDYDDDACDETH